MTSGQAALVKKRTLLESIKREWSMRKWLYMMVIPGIL